MTGLALAKCIHLCGMHGQQLVSCIKMMLHM